MDWHTPDTRIKDGRAWRIGDDATVSWIADGTSITKAITAAIPPVFDAYATLELPESWKERLGRHDAAVIELLTRHTARQPWWLGYLDTGADDVVFADAPRATLYTGWKYVLVEAGPGQAASWRASGGRTFWKGPLPNLMFPANRSWLVSTLWDDDWTCIGGRAALVEDLLDDPELGPRAREVRLVDDDATPPGHEAR
ncbi:MAG TPA: hypothetical protein VG165_06585 [Solirubrobacteraceae bacterium]|jgi:hypothetical protein|nr:hypothetical protein [Solirubrobacteraceae bacterium]